MVGVLLKYRLVQYLLIALVVLLWTFFYFIAADQALAGNPRVYEDLLNAAFVLAGFGIAAVVLAPERRRLFGAPTIVLLVAALLMFGNLLLPAYGAIDYSKALPSTIYSFDFFVVLGAVGSLGFFGGLALMIVNLLKWYYGAEPTAEG